MLNIEAVCPPGFLRLCYNFSQFVFVTWLATLYDLEALGPCEISGVKFKPELGFVLMAGAYRIHVNSGVRAGRSNNVVD